MAELPRPLPPPTWRDRFEVARRLPVGLMAAVAVVAVVSIGVTYALTTGVGRGPGTDVALTLPRAGSAAALSDDAPPPTAGGELHVHAAGAVVQPGVVTVPAGARVTDVVAAAGGPTPDADLNQVNLAAPVADGERIYIPRHGETASLAAGHASVGTAGKAGALVNINEADQATLETLPGVGPSTAQAIIEYRQTHGRFRSVDDLLNVRGIGPAKLSQIKPHARV